MELGGSKEKRVDVPSFWYSAVALLCCLSSFAHVEKLSCGDVAASSRFRRMISRLRIWAR